MNSSSLGTKPSSNRQMLLFLFVILNIFARITAQEAGWSKYKSRFLDPEGRIVDTGNKNVSHTEGQGMGMLLAVFNEDKETFDKLWKWTNDNLYREDIGLYAGRYDPHSYPEVQDKNTVTHGDLLIALALLFAGAGGWQNPLYFEATNKLQEALIKHTVIDHAGYKIMLPGVDGYVKDNVVTVNPAYFVFPAWHFFQQYNVSNVWEEVDESALKMLDKMRFGESHLTPDWVDIGADGSVKPGSRWPARFSYDAIRIPLYLGYAHPDSSQLSPFIEFWKKYPRDATPAWIDVVTGETASYKSFGGLLAVRDFTMSNRDAISDTFGDGDDYYSATLQLMSWWMSRK